MPVTPDEFKGALRRFAAGVTVVTARAGQEDVGITVSAFCSLSLNPPRVLVCIQKGAAMHETLTEAGAFGVTLLAGGQDELSNRFAGRFPRDQDRFADLAIARAPVSGAAWLPGGLAWLDCAVVAVHDGGDHSIFVGEVQGVSLNGERDAHDALLYLAGRYRKVGDAI